MSHHTKILAALMWVAPGYSGISPELKFVNLVVVLRAKPAEQARGCRQNDQLGALLQALNVCGHVRCQPHRVGIALALKNPKRCVRP
jgi:hypothetical protein